MATTQAAFQEAQRAQHFAMLGRLTAGVSHEIRNPLGAIFLHVDLLQEVLREPSPESPGEIAETLAEIQTNLRRLDDLVQDYLSLVRVASIQRTPQEPTCARHVRVDATKHVARRSIADQVDCLIEVFEGAFIVSFMNIRGRQSKIGFS